jgi:hypothetical protein
MLMSLIANYRMLQGISYGLEEKSIEQYKAKHEHSD